MRLGLFCTEETSISPLPYKIWSCSFDETKILKGILLLYNGGKSFDLDPTYSTGRFWNGLPQPKMKFDLSPKNPGVEKADAIALPLKDESVNSIMFDPPFVVQFRKSNIPSGIIAKRFSAYPSIEKLWEFYGKALIEFWRILKSEGILVFKCQDQISGSTQYWSSLEIMKMAESIGYYQLDLFVLGRNPCNVLWGANIKRQQHARKNHCFFIVFQKPKRRIEAKKTEEKGFQLIP